MIRSIRRAIRRMMGRSLNAMGAPGFIQAGTYRSLGVDVRVFVGESHTTISVNGLDATFRRLDGKFDGCGAMFESATPFMRQQAARIINRLNQNADAPSRPDTEKTSE